MLGLVSHNNNNNNNSRIFITPYGRNFRGAGERDELDHLLRKKNIASLRFLQKPFVSQRQSLKHLTLIMFELL